MYFITIKRMLEVCFSAHPNIQYRALTVPDFALYGRICSVGLYQDIEILS